MWFRRSFGPRRPDLPGMREHELLGVGAKVADDDAHDDEDDEEDEHGKTLVRIMWIQNWVPRSHQFFPPEFTW